MLALIISIARRLITAISTPFRMMIVRVQRMFNINILSAKLIQPLTKNVKKLMTLRPSAKTDYVRVGGFLVFRQLIRLVILAACAGVFIYFKMFAAQISETPVSLMGIKTDVTYSYDDIAVKGFTGVANIKSFDGGIVYTGEITNGVCKGMGLLYARDGSLVYEGGFDNNKYNGYGVKYGPEGNVTYEGGFADNLYSGTGKLYNAKGTVLYSGSFAAGQYEGEGKLYDERGDLIYEGAFSSGKSHGTGTQYYSGGVLHYRGEFFGGLFQGQGELYDKTGRLLYTGAMREGKINYLALTGATLAEVESAFSETPTIFYQEDGNSCYFYEKAGVMITTDCRLKVYEWEREKENPSDGYYYMPEESGYDFNGGDASGQSIFMSADGNFTVTPMSWITTEPYNPDGNSGADSSQPDADVPDAPDVSSRIDEPDHGISSYVPETVPENSGSSKPDSSGGGTDNIPDFVDRTKQLYFEIDKDVWQPEQELDKSKVFIKRVTVIGDARPPESGMTPIEDNGPPGVEDCVAIDYIRRQSPTAFSDVSFEMDKQNKLFQRLWNISYANRIIRSAFIAENVTYRYCYEPGDTASPVYYSIETL